MRSLVIDDEIVALSKVRSTLSRFGEADTANSGAEALASFREALRCRSPYDLVTIDINLPDINGLKLLREFANLERLNASTPSKKIIVTAEGTTAAVTVATGFRCDDFIVKPFRREVLIRKVRNLGLDLPLDDEP